jgi:hypothetical protein
MPAQQPDVKLEELERLASVPWLSPRERSRILTVFPSVVTRLRAAEAVCEAARRYTTATRRGSTMVQAQSYNDLEVALRGWEASL